MKLLLRTVLLLVFALPCAAQEFVQLYPDGKMPNSKGIELKDDIRNERIYQVGKPGMYVFLPSQQENKGAAVIICPGGGYERLAYMISGTSLAKWFNSMGVAAFVLNYRLPTSPDLVERSTGPLGDAQRAVRVIRANAAKWQIVPDKIGIMGSSAGGHLAANLGISTIDYSKTGDETDKFSFAPNFMILVSPVISMGDFAHAGSRKNLLGEKPTPELVEKFSLEKQVTDKTPPVIIFHAADDKTVSPRNSLMFASAMVEKGVSASLHIFPTGGHAIALRNNPGSTGEWTRLCELWMIESGFIPLVKK